MAKTRDGTPPGVPGVERSVRDRDRVAGPVVRAAGGPRPPKEDALRPRRPGDGSDLRVLPGAEELRQVVEEKLHVIRLFRAVRLAETGRALHSDPGEDATLDLIAHDHRLLAALDALDDWIGRQAPAGAEWCVSVAAETIARHALSGAARIRGAVLDALPARPRREVRAAIPLVGACKAEVWMKLEHYRRVVPRCRRRLVHPPLPKDEYTSLLAWHYAIDQHHEWGLEHVRRQEAKTLPRAEAIEPWLARLPVGWLRVVARLHDLPAGERKADLVRAIAGRLRHQAWLARVLRNRMGPGERWQLGVIAAVGPARLDTIRGNRLRAAFRVPWDWAAAPPAESAARLRALGLVFVGTVRGRRTVGMPAELRPVVWRALCAADRRAGVGLKRGLDEVFARAERRLRRGPAPIVRGPAACPKPR